jgi:hypothetical protein
MKVDGEVAVHGCIKGSIRLRDDNGLVITKKLIKVAKMNVLGFELIMVCMISLGKVSV